MVIAVVGAGYVGLTTAACLAKLGNKVICIDIDKEKINKLKRGEMPLFEAGLEEIVKEAVKENKLFFENSIGKVTEQTQVYFICVGTPAGPDNKADLSFVKQAAENIGKNLNKYAVIVNKSTVPVGTGDLVKNIIKRFYQGEFDIVSNPEFLRQGKAVQDFLNPDRIVVGAKSEKSKQIMKKIYQPFDCPILFTDLKTAELIKYASNSFLASSISFINSIADLCEKVGADVCEVARGMKLDKRIGEQAFLNAGIGYGGSCFPKDVKALIATAKDYGCNLDILEKVEMVNQKRVQCVVSKIESLIRNLNQAVIAVWGLTFKAETDDIRESPAMAIIEALRPQVALIKGYDPILNGVKLSNIDLCLSPLQAARDSDLVLITTDSKEFKGIDKKELKNIMRRPNIVDGRNIFDPKEMKDLGFNYLGIGR